MCVYMCVCTWYMFSIYARVHMCLPSTVPVLVSSWMDYKVVTVVSFDSLACAHVCVYVCVCACVHMHMRVCVCMRQKCKHVLVAKLHNFMIIFMY